MKCQPLLYVLALHTATLVAPAMASSTDLRIAGSISPAGPCEVTLQGGVIDLGRVSRNKLHATQPTPLGTKNLMLDIHCESKSRYAIATTSASGKQRDFGLFSAVDQSPVGILEIFFRPKEGHTDGAPHYLTVADDGADLPNAAWEASTSSSLPAWNGAQLAGFVDTEGSKSGPSFARHLHAILGMKPAISPANELDLRDDIAFGSVVSFELRYF